MESVRKTVRNYVHIDQVLVRQALAEFIGTAFLIVIGDGSVAQSVLSYGEKGGFLTINFAWGFGVAFAVYICGTVSSGHINPAISLANYLLGNLSLIGLLVYSIAQVLGAFFGAVIVYITYYDAFQAFDNGTRMVTGVKATAGIFATYPAPHLSIGGGLVDQIVGTTILALAVMAICDPRNAQVPGFLGPLLVGLVVAVIGMTYGFNCGYAINPARDLGPRLFTLVGGWGTEVFSFRDGTWFWVPIVGPFLGAVLGVWLYKLFIGLHWPRTEEERREKPGAEEHLLTQKEDTANA